MASTWLICRLLIAAIADHCLVVPVQRTRERSDSHTLMLAKRPTSDLSGLPLEAIEVNRRVVGDPQSAARQPWPTMLAPTDSNDGESLWSGTVIIDVRADWIFEHHEARGRRDILWFEMEVRQRFSRYHCQAGHLSRYGVKRRLSQPRMLLLAKNSSSLLRIP